MEDRLTITQIEQLEKRLAKAQKKGTLLDLKTKMLEEMLQEAKQHEEDARSRESNANVLLQELVARQREVNLMLNRSNSLVSAMYETNRLLAVEFKDVMQSLPAPQKAELEQKISRIDELFQRTGIPDAQISGLPALDSANDDFVDVMSDEPGEDNQDKLWASDNSYKPPFLVAEPVEEKPVEDIEEKLDKLVRDISDGVEGADVPEEDLLDDKPQKWWRRFRLNTSEGQSRF